MPKNDIVFAHVRLLILRGLYEMAGYEGNESMLDDVLEHWGLSVSRDTVRAQIRWLEEQGLVTLRNIGEYYIARITGRGEDVATGKAHVPGVKRPRA